MASTAGQMSTTPSGNPQWRAANGSVIYGYAAPVAPQTNRPHTGRSYGTYRDWVLQMGFNRTRGIGGWRINLPRDPGATWFVTVTDDSSDGATIPAGVDALHPPAGVK
jgi:hypothetical protein